MKTVCVLLAIMAVASASSYFDIPQNKVREAKVNAVNAQRQIAVNYYAEKVGASSGTARKDGVPGTPLGVTGKGYGYYPAAYPAGYGAYPAAYGAYPAAYGYGAYPAAYGYGAYPAAYGYGAYPAYHY